MKNQKEFDLQDHEVISLKVMEILRHFHFKKRNGFTSIPVALCNCQIKKSWFGYPYIAMRFPDLEPVSNITVADLFDLPRDMLMEKDEVAIKSQDIQVLHMNDYLV